jgi:hypothetical protein
MKREEARGANGRKREIETFEIKVKHGDRQDPECQRKQTGREFPIFQEKHGDCRKILKTDSPEVISPMGEPGKSIVQDECYRLGKIILVNRKAPLSQTGSANPCGDKRHRDNEI